VSTRLAAYRFKAAFIQWLVEDEGNGNVSDSSDMAIDRRAEMSVGMTQDESCYLTGSGMSFAILTIQEVEMRISPKQLWFAQSASGVLGAMWCLSVQASGGLVWAMGNTLKCNGTTAAARDHEEVSWRTRPPRVLSRRHRPRERLAQAKPGDAGERGIALDARVTALVEIPLCRMRRTTGWWVMWLVVGLALAGCASHARAQTAEKLDAYMQMSCSELYVERSLLRKEIVALQHPSRVDDPQWHPTANSYGIVNQLINERCRKLSNEEQRLPNPSEVPLMPEKELVDIAMRAVRGGKLEIGERLLLQGSLAGYPSAQFNLGMINHLRGRTKSAERWLRSAAQQGHADAAQMLEAITRKK
jgi:hypothetical protein